MAMNINTAKTIKSIGYPQYNSDGRPGQLASADPCNQSMSLNRLALLVKFAHSLPALRKSGIAGRMRYLGKWHRLGQSEVSFLEHLGCSICGYPAILHRLLNRALFRAAQSCPCLLELL